MLKDVSSSRTCRRSVSRDAVVPPASPDKRKERGLHVRIHPMPAFGHYNPRCCSYALYRVHEGQVFSHKLDIFSPPRGHGSTYIHIRAPPTRKYILWQLRFPFDSAVNVRVTLVNGLAATSPSATSLHPSPSQCYCPHLSFTARNNTSHSPSPSHSSWSRNTNITFTRSTSLPPT